MKGWVELPLTLLVQQLNDHPLEKTTLRAFTAT